MIDNKRWCSNMSLLSFSFRNFYGAAVAASVLLASALAHADGPFTGYAGNWSGNGTISIADSGTERIRCKGVYTVDSSGNGLHQSIRCASDSYKFELSSDVLAKGNQITGNWSEASRNVNGSIEGSISGGDISALVTTNGYAATFAVSLRGNKQNVNISSKGELRGVTMSLARN